MKDRAIKPIKSLPNTCLISITGWFERTKIVFKMEKKKHFHGFFWPLSE
jgi:hypothetical protein